MSLPRLAALLLTLIGLPVASFMALYALFITCISYGMMADARGDGPTAWCALAVGLSGMVCTMYSMAESFLAFCASLEKADAPEQDPAPPPAPIG